ncbi:MAG: RNA polymerase sigma factor [Terriglobia bacterium]
MFTPLWRFLVHYKSVPKLDAEELVQDVLMKVHSKAGTFHRDGRAQLTTWIFHIAQNEAFDFHKVAREELLELQENDEPAEWHGPFAGRNAPLLAWLRDELEKLSAEDQQVLLWRAQDFSYADIARWLGIKKGTARVRYLRAKKKLGVPDNQPELLEVTGGYEMPESGGTHE